MWLGLHRLDSLLVMGKIIDRQFEIKISHFLFNCHLRKIERYFENILWSLLEYEAKYCIKNLI